jgi:hypothetical protein
MGSTEASKAALDAAMRPEEKWRKGEAKDDSRSLCYDVK